MPIYYYSECNSPDNPPPGFTPLSPGVLIGDGQNESSDILAVEVAPRRFVIEPRHAAKHLPPVLAKLAEELLALITNADTQQLIQRKRALGEESSAAIALLNQRKLSIEWDDVMVAMLLPCDRATGGRRVDELRSTRMELCPEVNRLFKRVAELNVELRMRSNALFLVHGSFGVGDFAQAKTFFEQLVAFYELEARLSSTDLRQHELSVECWQAEAELQHRIIHRLCTRAEGMPRPDKATLGFRVNLAKGFDALTELHAKLVVITREMLAAERKLASIFKKVQQRLTAAVRLQAKMGGAGASVKYPLSVQSA